MWSVAYRSDTVIMLCALSLKLMYRHFSKPYVLTLHAVLFSLFQYASTIVTYMIVLLQFEQSDKSHCAGSRNVTDWVTWRLELVCVVWQRNVHNLFSLSSLLMLLSLPTLSPLLSRHHYVVNGWCFFLIEGLYMWQNRPVVTNLQILISPNFRAAMTDMLKLNKRECRR